MVKAFETFDHITRAALPIFDFSISLHCIDQMGAAILHRNCVTVVMEPYCYSSLAFTLLFICVTYMFVNIFIASVS